MAKSRNFFGLRRGSTKNFTFQVQKGQQITKDRVLDVTNPRTNGQMMHRSLFANVIKFYKHGQQAFFKFAFEDKKPLESDYNAFVRHNIERSTRISKQASKSEMYPAIAPWQLTQGSLIEPSVVHSGSNIWRVAVAGLTSNVTAWSALQEVLISAFGLQNGDILTFVNIIAIGATESNMPSVDSFGGLVGNRWNVEQLQIGMPTKNDALPTFMNCDNGVMILDFANPSTDAYAQAVAFVISRKTPSGLKVSTSYLIANAAAENIIAKSSEARYIDEVLTSWSTSDEAILEGALVEKVSDKQGIAELSFTLPANTSTLEENVIILNKPDADYNFEEHLKFNGGSIVCNDHAWEYEGREIFTLDYGSPTELVFVSANENGIVLNSVEWV